MLEKYPNLFRLDNLLETRNSVAVQINGKWVPARPEGFASLTSRLKITWLVFTGRADAVIWPENQ